MFYFCSMMLGGMFLFSLTYIAVAAVRATDRAKYKSFMRAFKEELRKDW
jgi:hypothetical protein